MTVTYVTRQCTAMHISSNKLVIHCDKYEKALIFLFRDIFRKFAVVHTIESERRGNVLGHYWNRLRVNTEKGLKDAKDATNTDTSTMLFNVQHSRKFT